MTYTVRGVNKLRENVGAKNWTVWQVLVEGDDGTGIKAAETLLDAGEDGAARFPVGSALPEGAEIEQSEYGLKLRLGGKGGGGRGGGGWKPRIDDDPAVFAARQAAIMHQHSQDMAMRVLELTGRDEHPDARIVDVRALAAKACELAGIFTEDVEMVARSAELLRAQGRSDVPGNGAQPSADQPQPDEVLT